jgi:hypothetical protein
MFEKINANPVIRISSIAYVNNRLWVKIGIEPVVHSPFAINNDIRRDCLTNSRD